MSLARREGRSSATTNRRNIEQGETAIRYRRSGHCDCKRSLVRAGSSNDLYHSVYKQHIWSSRFRCVLGYWPTAGTSRKSLRPCRHDADRTLRGTLLELSRSIHAKSAMGAPANITAGICRFASLAGFIWSVALMASLLASVFWLWQLYGTPDNKRHWLGAAFAPAIVCLLIGQTSLFVLLGYVLFLRLHRSHPFWAGAALWLCALKPHLFVAIGAVMLAWVMVSKSYRVLAGATSALAASSVIAWLIDPAAWTQYAVMMRGSGINQEVIPCLSIVLRRWISPNSVGLQYLPAVIGCAWALTYYWRRRTTWDWVRDSGSVILVSILVSPYAWITDQALAIPALLAGAIRTRSQILLVLLAAASIVIEAELLNGIMLSSNLYLWTAPAWLAWYLLARGNTNGDSNFIHSSRTITEFSREPDRLFGAKAE